METISFDVSKTSAESDFMEEVSIFNEDLVMKKGEQLKSVDEEETTDEESSESGSESETLEHAATTQQQQHEPPPRQLPNTMGGGSVWSSWAGSALSTLTHVMESTEEAVGMKGDILSSASMQVLPTLVTEKNDAVAKALPPPAVVTTTEDAKPVVDHEAVAEAVADSLLRSFQWGWSSVVEQTKASLKQVEEVLISEEGWSDEVTSAGSKKAEETAEEIQISW